MQGAHQRHALLHVTPVASEISDLSTHHILDLMEVLSSHCQPVLAYTACSLHYYPLSLSERGLGISIVAQGMFDMHEMEHEMCDYLGTCDIP